MDGDTSVQIKHSRADCHLEQLGYSHCTRQDLNADTDILSVPLPCGILDHLDCNLNAPTSKPLIVTVVNYSASILSIDFHPLYPCRETISKDVINNGEGTFVQRFGIPFVTDNGSM